MLVFDTERLRVRRLELADAGFILRLLNEPSWIENIGDKNISSLHDATDYLKKGPFSSYLYFGFGLYMVERQADGRAIGLCGLIQRDGLDAVDLGFAFLPEFWGRGYAYEVSQAMLSHAKAEHRLNRLAAITLETNIPCIKLLGKLGFSFDKTVILAGETVSLNLYMISL